MRVRYDDARTRALLGRAIAPAALPRYFGRLVDYALLARWGAGALGRAHALELAAPGAGAVEADAAALLERAAA